MSMFFILPNRVNGLANLETNLTGHFLNHIDEMLQEQKLTILRIPKFEIKSDVTEMQSALKDLGVIDLYDSGTADLSGITNQQSLYVSDTIHKTIIKLSEEGTEAAAATGTNFKILQV